MKSKPLPINLNWKGGLTLNNFLVFYIAYIYYIQFESTKS